MFWGAQIQFDKKFVPEKEDYANLHLRNVSLLWAKEKISVVCTVKEQNENDEEVERDFVLCHLDENRVKSAKMNLLFDLTNQDVSFSVIGKGKVCLMGSLEAKEGAALTNELVKNLAPKIADAKKKMILDLAMLAKDMKNIGGDDDDEDLDDEEEYVEGMDLESDEDDEEEDEEEEEEEEEVKKPVKTEIKQQKQSVNIVSKKIEKQGKQNQHAAKQQQKPNQQNKNNKKGQQFNLLNTSKPKKVVEEEEDEFAAL